MESTTWVFLAVVGGILVGATYSLRGTCTLRDGATMVLYVSLSVAIDLTIATTSQHAGGIDPYEKLSVVIFVEFTKFVVSMGLLQFHAEQALGKISARDVLAVSLPACLYAANNWLLLATLERIDVGVFAVVRETNLVFTALLWVLVFRASLGTTRWACVGAIVGASILAQANSLVTVGVSASVLLALLLTSVNAAATVSNEKVLKGQCAHLDINQANVILYCLCGGSALLMALMKHGPGFLGPQMFHGFSAGVMGICCGQAFLGLVVSRLLKHTSAVAKGVLTVFRPLILLVAAPVFTTTALNVHGLAAGLVAGAAAFVYLKQGPLVPQAPLKVDGAAAYGSVEPRAPQAKALPASPWVAALVATGLLATAGLVWSAHRPAHPGLRHGVFTQTAHPAAPAPVVLPESCDPELFTSDIELFCELKRTSLVHLDLPPLAPRGACALVSNSGEVKAHANGREIDAHSTVIRVNDAPIGGAFTQWVGQKQTVRFIEGEVTNFGKQQSYVEGLSREAAGAAPLLVVPFKGSRRGNLAEAERVLGSSKAVKLAYLTEGYQPALDSFRNFMLRTFPGFADPTSATTDPTTGGLAMLFALSTCDSVDAYSMHTPVHGSDYNYYSAGGSPTTNSWHGQLKAEHDLWTRVAATAPQTAQASGKMVLPGFQCVSCEGVATREAVLSPVALLSRLPFVAH